VKIKRLEIKNGKINREEFLKKGEVSVGFINNVMRDGCGDK
jgi:hypothetical protein